LKVRGPNSTVQNFDERVTLPSCQAASWIAPGEVLVTVTGNLRTTLAVLCLVGLAWLEQAQGVTISSPIQVGTTNAAALRETSGIVGSNLPGVIWTHNDSGDSARFFAVATDGTPLGQFSLAGASSNDWEDMARGPKSGGGSYLYLGDVGDNDRLRSSIAIHRVPEPDTSAGGTIAVGDYQTAVLQYPGGSRNAESLMVDPWTGDLFLVTKSPSGQVYRASADVFDQVAQLTTLQSLGNLNAFLPEPSGADISPDGRMILVRNRSTTACLWTRHTGQSVWDAMQGTPLSVTLAAESQGEAIGWAADSQGFFTVSEWSSTGPRPIYYYAVSVPEPASVQLAACALLALAVWRLRSTRRA
jgi:hypothetical protein